MNEPAGPAAAQIVAALDEVCDPCSLATGTPQSIIDMGLVRSWVCDDGAVAVTLCVTGPGCTFIGTMADAARAALLALPGVSEARVMVDPTVVWSEALMSPAARDRLQARRRATVARLGIRPQEWRQAQADASRAADVSG